MKSRAFTLVELMVVLVVIGILSALLYPAINKVRENGRQAQCSNNLKELHTAVMTFASNSGRFPYATTYQAFYENSWHEHVGWVSNRVAVALGTAGLIDMWDESAFDGSSCVTNGTLYSYVQDKRVYLCPTFAIEAKAVEPTKKFARCYVMNWNLNWQNLYALSDGSKRMLFTEVNVAKKMQGLDVTGNSVFDTGNILNSDSSIIYYTPQQTDGALMVKDANLPPSEGIGAHHNGKGHVVFADGHVEFLYYSNTWDTATANW
jgi:prepilin-type N-terminal cleavage/methylation domain-containing protein/prepilin-type processing-associated H-X9-DG protein